MTKDLYLVSSVFHLLIAAAVVAARPNNKPYFVFTRFNQQRYQMILPCLLNLVASIEQVLYLDDTATVKQRKKNSGIILDFARRHQTTQIFVGNDRHVEFQYLAHFLKKEVSTLICVYLDEGLYSYIGRKSSGSFAERVIDQGLKKLVYGAWWQTPKTIGASRYIDEVWLAYPEQACSILQIKPCQKLPSKGFESFVFKEFISCWGELFNLPKDLDQINFILTITDEKNFTKFPNYQKSMVDLVESLLVQNMKVAVKYHPNANKQDLLSLAQLSDQVTILPSDLPFEIVLPLLSESILIAEFSSTLITSRLLRPQMPVWSIVHASQNVPEELNRLCSVLKIKSFSIDALKQKIKEV